MIPTCNHQLALGVTGLCESCQADYDEDPQAWLEFGEHPGGEANWKALQEEIAASAAKPATPAPPDPSIPF